MLRRRVARLGGWNRWVEAGAVGLALWLPFVLAAHFGAAGRVVGA